ncbi:MAG: hypothetical protein ACLS8R_06885 [Anaeromassilibacillus sp.]
MLNEPGLEDCPGVVGIAGKLCTCDEQYNGILHSLLGRIVVAEDLDAATASPGSTATGSASSPWTARWSMRAVR